jgi:hypothetical protein
VTLQRFLFNALNGCARKSKKAAIFAWRNFENWRGLHNRLNKCARIVAAVMAIVDRKES